MRSPTKTLPLSSKMNKAPTDIFEALKKWWGYDSFRPGQDEVIKSVCAGRDTLALMPTGAGKSLLYQLPTMTRTGLCIVVTPLIALMKDQVDALRRKGINAVAIHAGLTPRSIDIALDNCVYGDVKFLYIAPERIDSEIFTARLRKMKVALVAVDEAHCISQWGYDFRPSYLKIAEIRKIVPSAPILALTASATPEVADDIMQKLCFTERNVMRSDFARPNISFAVRHTDDKREQLRRILDNVAGSGIVYMRTRQGCERLAGFLREEGYSAGYYHAGLPHVERNLRQDEWLTDKIRIMVATNAFGMGIDKADVRFVVHYDICESLEAYYQEAGRAGRDGRRSYAVLLAGSDERPVAEKRFKAEFPEVAAIKSCYDKICTYLQVGYGDGRYASFLFDIYDFCVRNHLFAPQVRNCLKVLSQNGYVTLSDEAENPARLMFCVSRDDLYDFRVRRAELDGVLRTVLRLYEGVFTEFRPIDLQEIALHSGYTEERVAEMLKILWRQHVIRYVPRSFSPILTLLADRVPERDVLIDYDTYRMRKGMAAERLEKMFEYADLTDTCRSVYLQRYFGQNDATDCGACDVCIGRRKTKPDAAADMCAQVLDLIEHSEHLSPREAVRNFAVDPEDVLAAIDRLTREGKISLSAEGFLVKNR